MYLLDDKTSLSNLMNLVMIPQEKTRDILLKLEAKVNIVLNT